MQTLHICTSTRELLARRLSGKARAGPLPASFPRSKPKDGENVTPLCSLPGSLVSANTQPELAHPCRRPPRAPATKTDAGGGKGGQTSARQGRALSTCGLMLPGQHLFPTHPPSRFLKFTESELGRIRTACRAENLEGASPREPDPASPIPSRVCAVAEGTHLSPREPL